MTNKKQKLLSGILTSVTTLAVAGGVTGLIVGLTKKNPTHPQFLNGKTINFSAGEGSIAKNQPKSTTVESGTTFDRVDQPVVNSSNPRKIFAGWRDQNGELVRGNATVRKDMQLTATYNDANSSEYVTVLFALDPTQEGAVLQGNQRVSVTKGYYFFMVNRPTAKWTVTTAEGVVKQKYFKGWRYADGNPVQENDKITTNQVLYPIFNEAVTVTWHPNGAHAEDTPAGEGIIERGQETTTLETNTTFTKFNQPALKYKYVTEPGEGDPKAYFAGWYKNQECTEEWGESEVLTADANAYAKWAKEPAVGDQYGTITFTDARNTMVDGTTLPATLTFGWTPSDSIIVKLGDKTWGDTNKPSIVVYKSGVITNDYKVASWEISYQDASTSAWSDWATLADEYVFPMGTKAYKIRPVLQYAVDSITVYGDESARVEGIIQYNVLIEGGSTSSQAVTWQLVTDDSGKDTPFPDGLAEISNTGLVTVKSVSRALWEEKGLNCFYVKATSQLDSSKRDYLKVSISMPYQNNSYIWIHTESSESSDPRWYYADIDAFCDSTTTSVITYAYSDPTGATTHTFDKTVDFTDTITFGTDLGAIPNNFLAGWTNFKGSVDLANSNIAVIGNEFMAGCTNYNNPLSMNKIITIGANFLKGCTSFNQPITFAAAAPLVEIGDGFLHSCTKFNSVITLPQTYQLWINTGFLFNCTSYNQPLTLPSIIMYIGDFFMSDCNAFNSVLTTAVPMDRFVVSDGSLSSTNSNAEIYKTGFGVGGTQAENFKLYYKTISEGHYRTIRTDYWDGAVTAEQFNTAKDKLINNNSFTVTIRNGGTIWSEAPSSNADSPIIKWTNSSKVTNFIKKDAVHGDMIENKFDENGKYVTSERITNSSTSAIYKINYFRDLLKQTPTYSSTVWVFDANNKTYTYTISAKNRISLKFEKETKNISYIEYYQNSRLSWTGTFSNVGTTTIADKPASFSPINETTYDTASTSFIGTCSTLLTEDYTKATFVIPANADAGGYEIDAYEDGETLTQPYAITSAYYFVPTSTARNSMSVYLNGQTNKYVIKGTMKANYVVVVTVDIGRATTKPIHFTAKPVANISTMKFGFKEDYAPIQGTEVTMWYDEGCTKSLPMNTAVTFEYGKLNTYYVKLKNSTLVDDVIDNRYSRYKVGSGDWINFSSAYSKIYATQVSTSTTEKLYKIEVKANTEYSSGLVQIELGFSPLTQSNVTFVNHSYLYGGATNAYLAYDAAGTQPIDFNKEYYFTQATTSTFYAIMEGADGFTDFLDLDASYVKFRDSSTITFNDSDARITVTEDSSTTSTRKVYKIDKTFISYNLGLDNQIHFYFCAPVYVTPKLTKPAGSPEMNVRKAYDGADLTLDTPYIHGWGNQLTMSVDMNKAGYAIDLNGSTLTVNGTTKSFNSWGVTVQNIGWRENCKYLIFPQNISTWSQNIQITVNFNIIASS